MLAREAPHAPRAPIWRPSTGHAAPLNGLGGGVVEVAPAPVLPGLGGLHHRVLVLVEVGRGVAACGGVTAADVPALQALTESDPHGALAQAVDALRLLP